MNHCYYGGDIRCEYAIEYIQTDSEEVEHYEDAIVIKHNVSYKFGNLLEDTYPTTQLIVLNEDNDKIKRQTEYWNNKPLFKMNGVCKAWKYLNGNGITRVVFGLASGRFIE